MLCLDVGDRNIGVAISDSSQTIAQGIYTFKFPSSSTQTKVNRIKELLSAYEIDSIVVGMPLDLKGREGQQAKKVKEFTDKLKDELDIPVTFFDERFTSLAAERSLKEEGMSIERRKKLRDKVAATILLQNYLDLLKINKTNKE